MKWVNFAPVHMYTSLRQDAKQDENLCEKSRKPNKLSQGLQEEEWEQSLEIWPNFKSTSAVECVCVCVYCGFSVVYSFLRVAAQDVLLMVP